MDTTADPCEDFYQYACGQWNNKHVIPEEEHSYDTFHKLQDELKVTLRRKLTRMMTSLMTYA
jgi:membrane metallo-endopeptidase-like protein 1